jgi:hypothetical protein
LFGANTQPASEGSVGSPISESTSKIVATIGQYCDFINSSDLAMDVAIDDPSLLQNLATELNYRLALSLNTLVQLTADASAAVDGNVNIDLTGGALVQASTIRAATQSLKGVNARPLTKDSYWGGMYNASSKQVKSSSIRQTLMI